MKKIVLLVAMFVCLYSIPVESARYQEVLLSVTNIDLSQEGDTVIYRVPRNRNCVLTKAVLIIGSDAGRSVISIGQTGDEGDFIDSMVLYRLDMVNDAIMLVRNIYDAYPQLHSYSGRTVIKASILTAEGGTQNKLFLYGILY